MNLHVTNDSYGMYPIEIAKRIKASKHSSNNLIVNLSVKSVYKDPLITYLPISVNAFRKYSNSITKLDKIIFHPYNLTAYKFLKVVLDRFPNVNIYWICWSYELYKLPHLETHLFEPFATRYLKKIPLTIESVKFRIKEIIKKGLVASGFHKSPYASFVHSFSLVSYFCSPFYADYLFLKNVSPSANIQYQDFAYLSLNKIMPELSSFHSVGNEIMIGHSALPDANHYEIIQILSAIDLPFSVFLPLVYGDKKYASIIKNEAESKFEKVEVLETKLEMSEYYRRLTQIGWAVLNTKVQQGVGNIIALVWMGVKLFLDKNVSTYIDFKKWGVVLFSIQEDLTFEHLSKKLLPEEVENNRKIILERFNEKRINMDWELLLQ